MDAQAGLRLCCSQFPEDRFSRVNAHMIMNYKLRYFFSFKKLYITQVHSIIEKYFLSKIKMYSTVKYNGMLKIYLYNSQILIVKMTKNNLTKIITHHNVMELSSQGFEDSG